MMRYFLLSITFLSLVAALSLEGAEPLQIKVFRGVDQSVDALDLEPGQASGGYDVNLGQTQGSWEAREGFALYDATDTLGNRTGIHGYIGKNGERRLFSTVQSDDPWDYVVWTDEYGSTFDNEANIRFYRNETTHWLTIDDKVVCANGINPPVRWVEDGWQPLTEAPPGEPRFDPVKSSNPVWVLDGDYKYSLAFTINHGMTEPVRVIHVDSGHIMLSAIPLQSIYRNDADTVWPTTFALIVSRTKSGVSDRDSMFVIDTIDFERADDTFIVDSIPDAYLGVTLFYDDDSAFVDTNDCTDACDSTEISYPYAGIPDTGKEVHNGDTTFTEPFYETRPGQPQWMSTVFDTTSYFWAGISDGREGDTADDGVPIWKYTHYAFTYFDTATRMQTQIGSYLRVPTVIQGNSIGDSAIGIGIALPPTDKEYCFRIIYRRAEKEAKEEVPDSAYQSYSRRAERIEGDHEPGGGGSHGGGWSCNWNKGERLVWREGIAYCDFANWVNFDTTAIYNVIESWYPVDTIKTKTDSTYLDTLPWHVLELRDAYNDVDAGIFQVNYPTYYDNRLWMASGSYLYYCDFTAFEGLQIGRWPVSNIVAINPNDGDEIIWLHVSNGLLVSKNNSMHEAKEIDYDNVQIRELTKAYGCIASNSFVNLPGGGYGFLSRMGYKINSTALQSMYKEIIGTEEGITAPISKSLNSYSIDVRRGCHAFIDEKIENLCLSFPGVDTIWALALNGSGWMPWRYSYRQTTKYSADYEVDARPPDDIVGILNAKDSVYSFGGTTDTGLAITPLWISGPLGRGSWYGQITGYGLWKAGTDSTGLAVIIDAYREAVGESVRDSLVDTTGRYAIHEILSQAGLYFQVGLYVDGTVTDITVKQLDIWWQETEDLPGR